jgi:predicted restriction endonuclease
VPYLFARVQAKNDKGQTLPYVYCGRLRFLEYDVNTKNPVHIVYQSIDYYEDPANSELIKIYNWRTTRTDVNEALLERYEGQISDSRKSKYTKPNKTERRGLVISRVGQGYYREGLLIKWKGKCPVTGVEIAEILIASHILRWSECDDEARLDIDNGILLAPNVDALFDKHLISFTDEGELVYSTELNVEELKRLGIDFNVRIDVTEGMKKYLRLHRLSLR